MISRSLIILVLMSLGGVHCGSKSKLGGSAKVAAKSSPPTGGNPPPACLDSCNATPVTPTPSPEPQPIEPLEDTFDYTYSEYKPKVDYLLVVDNSSSMTDLISYVRVGLGSVASEEGFPGDSRIAVMSTLVGKAPGYSEVESPYITGYGNGAINSEPGFLKFINRSRILAYKDVLKNPTLPREVKDLILMWPKDGCESEWFAPKDVSPSGEPCLEAAMQSSLSGGPVEAGIHAFKQLMLKNQGKALFRKGAFLNVLFVSDTQDPGSFEGVGKPLLLDVDTYSHSKLKELVLANNPGLQLVRFHAISPKKDAFCGESDVRKASFKETYYGLTADSSGFNLEFCSTLQDPMGRPIDQEVRKGMYREFIKKMIAGSYSSEPRFVLRTRVDRVTKVLVNGVEVTQYKILSDELTIQFEDLPKVGQQKIQVMYLPKS